MCPKHVNTKLPKKKPQNVRQGPPGLPGGLPDATPSPAYLGASPQLEPITALFTLCYNAALRNYFTNLQKVGQGHPPTLPAQRASTSEPHACTSMASCGDPSSCGVECTGEWPLTVALESNHRPSKVRGSSLSIMDPHSHDCLCGSASHSISPCSNPVPPDDNSPGSSKSAGSSSSRSPPSPSACLPPPLDYHHCPLPPRRNHRSSS